MNKKEVMAFWETRVIEARGLIENIRLNQMRVAEIALEICDISRGGGNHWNGYKDVFTLKNFAEAINLPQPTLYKWITVKRNVFDKLTKKDKKELKVDKNYKHLVRVAEKIGPDAQPALVKSVLKKAIEAPPAQAGMYRVLQEIKHVKCFVTEYKNELNKEQLKEIKEHCSRILTEIRLSGKGA